MRVNLAAQVSNVNFGGSYIVIKINFSGAKYLCSKSLGYYALEEAMETEKFVQLFDKCFDCLNVRCTSASVRRWKPDLRPYRSPDDPRLKVSSLLFT